MKSVCLKLMLASLLLCSPIKEGCVTTKTSAPQKNYKQSEVLDSRKKEQYAPDSPIVYACSPMSVYFPDNKFGSQLVILLGINSPDSSFAREMRRIDLYKANSAANKDEEVFRYLESMPSNKGRYFFRIPLLEIPWNSRVSLETFLLGETGDTLRKFRSEEKAYLGKHDIVLLPYDDEQKMILREGIKTIKIWPASGSKWFQDDIGINFIGRKSKEETFRDYARGGEYKMFYWARINPVNPEQLRKIRDERRGWNGVHAVRPSNEYLLGQPLTHGCVNICSDNAKKHFEWTYVGMPIFLARNSRDFEKYLEEFRSPLNKPNK